MMVEKFSLVKLKQLWKTHSRLNHLVCTTQQDAMWPMANIGWVHGRVASVSDVAIDLLQHVVGSRIIAVVYKWRSEEITLVTIVICNLERY